VIQAGSANRRRTRLVNCLRDALAALRGVVIHLSRHGTGVHLLRGRKRLKQAVPLRVRPISKAGATAMIGLAGVKHLRQQRGPAQRITTFEQPQQCGRTQVERAMDVAVLARSQQ